MQQWGSRQGGNKTTGVSGTTTSFLTYQIMFRLPANYTSILLYFCPFVLYFFEHLKINGLSLLSCSHIESASWVFFWWCRICSTFSWALSRLETHIISKQVQSCATIILKSLCLSSRSNLIVSWNLFSCLFWNSVSFPSDIPPKLTPILGSHVATRPFLAGRQCRRIDRVRPLNRCVWSKVPSFQRRGF